ncbi:MAG: hypothetical protein V3U87_07100 [Methylococcaceae bacterium]|jgi:hypothetical protein
MKTRVLIPIRNQQELEELQYVLAEMIYTLSDPKQSEQQESIYWLSKILMFTFTLEDK